MIPAQERIRPDRGPRPPEQLEGAEDAAILGRKALKAVAAQHEDLGRSRSMDEALCLARVIETLSSDGRRRSAQEAMEIAEYVEPLVERLAELVVEINSSVPTVLA